MKKTIYKELLYSMFVILFCFSFTQIKSQTEVKSIAELQNEIVKSMPGSTILFSNGTYNAESCTLSAKGVENHPIVVKAINEGTVIFDAPIFIKGDYITLEGIKFKGKGNIQILGKGCRITKCEFDDASSGKWIRVNPESEKVEIDHNTFKNKNSNKDYERGCQLMQIVVLNKNEQHHIHHNTFQDIPQGSGNGFETLQLITHKNPFDPPPGHCNTIIEENMFLRCNGEAEIISVKSNGNIIRGNTFRACRGSLVLRHGDDNVVSGNFFFGDGEAGSGGVRIQGTGQIVTNNYFHNLEKFGLGMMDGTPDDLYIRVENAKILYNTFINCNNTMVVGLNHSKHPNGTVPKNCVIEGNIFYQTNAENKTIEYIQGDTPEGWTWKNNVVFGDIVEYRDINLLNKDPLLDFTKIIALPTKNTPKFEQSDEAGDIVRIDLLGNKRTKLTTVGAIQYSSGNLEKVKNLE